MESFSVAKQLFYEEQKEVFKESMAFAEASWKRRNGPKAVIAWTVCLWVSLCWLHKLKEWVFLKWSLTLSSIVCELSFLKFGHFLFKWLVKHQFILWASNKMKCVTALYFLLPATATCSYQFFRHLVAEYLEHQARKWRWEKWKGKE